MAPSRARHLHHLRHLRYRLTGAPGASLWPFMALLLLAVALGVVAALGTIPGHAWADAQPALAISVKSGTSTQTTYVVAATGFPASVPFTETYGDGTGIPAATGTTSATGSFTLFWTLDIGAKYCGTITAMAGSAQASTSFWVAAVSDPASGTSCAGQGASGTPTVAPTPAASATATAQATATPVAPATAVSSSSGAAGPPGGGSAGMTALLKRVPWLWVGGGAMALLLLLIIIAALGAGKRSSSQDARRPARGMPTPPGRGRGQNGPWGTDSNWRRQPMWRAPRVVEKPPMYRPEERPSTRHRVPGAGPADPRWRIMDPEDPRRRAPEPDPRWSRSQVGRRPGGRGRNDY